MTRRFNKPSGGPSQRQLRVGEVIRKELSDAFIRGEVVDPDLEGRVITVPEVRMSPDLKVATVYIMPLGGEGSTDIAKILARHARFLRGFLSPRLNMKFMPDLRFRLDETFETAAKMDALLRSPHVAQDLGEDDDPDDTDTDTTDDHDHKDDRGEEK